jgi:hypothetical protein
VSSKFIIVFSTGRCGTALLAQYFGGVTNSKCEWRFRDNTAIAHEPFDNVKRYWEVIDDVKKGKKSWFIKGILMVQLEKLQNCRQFVITDNKLGRWFLDDFLYSKLETKVIYLHRDERAVVRSMRKFCRKWGSRWCYQKSDAHSSVNRTMDPYWYHVKETSSRWRKAQDKLRPGQYMEVSFERFLTERKHRTELEAFVGLSGYEDLLKVKVNPSKNRIEAFVDRLIALLKRLSGSISFLF